ncbi:MAG: sigma-70 family RNA polymerase sigma factor [Candidatus Hydrogenedentes bacterium]|nr:sigma-70 family RNA polymerase sigma factor [Candidatus Hydrogenedentota bacterium]
MTPFNIEFWEIPASSKYLENLPAERALWYETEAGRERRYALHDFFQAVLPVVNELIESRLTSRQRQILHLYYLAGKTQEDIAAELCLSQSTVSRHLFGTVRQGRKVGGAIPKLRKAIEHNESREIHAALDTLQARFTQAAECAA